ncbi:DOPA 4,5-dioxygenase family protein [Nisaea sediminum]|uniref:DOPA 4,5-dioxygenase family protein n=1 Tax=Nisaea sediminum TaxID=2775867 RepID=UPI0018696D21|nr:DOPA 4,5-dioxygenase family protein [Nisaea sediminum]
MTRDVSEIRGYHAHVYFDAGTVDAARRLRDEIERRFDIEMGRFHEKPVGPHPRFSYQVAFAPELFGSLVPWLSLNREGLTVFVHADTGEDLRDHTDHVLWLGESEALKLSIFDR